MIEDLVIRTARDADVPHVAKLAAQLVRMHHDADPARFLLVENVEAGYARWFARELSRPQAIILVACRNGHVIGYAYGTLDERDWNLLIDTHGVIQDIFVANDARRHGAARMLVDALVRALGQLGAPQIVLSTMVANESAQRLFRRCGFRATMVEMTRDAHQPGGDDVAT
ncbi:MAG: GNAT family N-acetyltransferase [Myxococcota bacterium]|nr:GNAT family N-acetyltransferase [Myxococcota bacterium]